MHLKIDHLFININTHLISKKQNDQVSTAEEK